MGEELGGDTLPLRPIQQRGLGNLSAASTQLRQTEFTYLDVIGGGDSTCPPAQPLGTAGEFGQPVMGVRSCFSL